jgi:hypothetical protein
MNDNDENGAVSWDQFLSLWCRRLVFSFLLYASSTTCSWLACFTSYLRNDIRYQSMDKTNKVLQPSHPVCDADDNRRITEDCTVMAWDLGTGVFTGGDPLRCSPAKSTPMCHCVSVPARYSNFPILLHPRHLHISASSRYIASLCPSTDARGESPRLEAANCSGCPVTVTELSPSQLQPSISCSAAISSLSSASVGITSSHDDLD